MASNIPEDLKYTESHEWLKEGSGVVIIGITDFAQSQLGEIVFVELPAIGNEVQAKQECAVIESVKAASDIYAPVSGIIREVNNEIEENTELLNEDPYDKGWLFKIKPTNPGELDTLLTAKQYKDLTEKE